MMISGWRSLMSGNAPSDRKVRKQRTLIPGTKERKPFEARSALPEAIELHRMKSQKERNTRESSKESRSIPFPKKHLK